MQFCPAIRPTIFSNRGISVEMDGNDLQTTCNKPAICNLQSNQPNLSLRLFLQTYFCSNKLVIDTDVWGSLYQKLHALFCHHFCCKVMIFWQAHHLLCLLEDRVRFEGRSLPRRIIYLFTWPHPPPPPYHILLLLPTSSSSFPHPPPPYHILLLLTTSSSPPYHPLPLLYNSPKPYQDWWKFRNEEHAIISFMREWVQVCT